MGGSCINSNDAWENGRVLFREHDILGKSCIERRGESESPIWIALENRKVLYIMAQMTVYVSVSGLSVSTILYTLICMHKRTKSQNCDFCVL